MSGFAFDWPTINIRADIDENLIFCQEEGLICIPRSNSVEVHLPVPSRFYVRPCLLLFVYQIFEFLLDAKLKTSVKAGRFENSFAVIMN